jgi:hypothetical protein
MASDCIKAKLIAAACVYDARQAKRPGYNRYALPQYVARIHEVCDALPADALPADPSVRKGLLHGFSGRLADAMLKAVGQPKATNDEARAAGW